MARSPRPLRAVLLDLDGTLVDSNDAHALAWVDAFAEARRPVAFDDVRAAIGKGGDKLIPDLLGLDPESPDAVEIQDRRSAIFAERYLAGIRPFAGARELLEAFAARGLRRVVATSAKRSEVDHLLLVLGGPSAVDDVASSDGGGADRSKPDADVVEAALARAGCAPSEALLLGDTPYDVEAGRRAGVRVVAVGTGGWKRRQMFGAVAYYEDLTELLASYEASPFRAPVPEPRPERRPTRPTPPRLSRTLSPSRSRGAQR